MRDYTFIGGARFTVNHLFRSLRFDVDRLDMSWVDGEQPAFSRGLRIVDHEEGHTVTVDGAEGDSLIFSLAYIFNKQDNNEAYRYAVDEYLKIALEKRIFQVTEQKHQSEKLTEVSESILH
jgi:hypothetical protein